jgi:hypothetical protein
MYNPKANIQQIKDTQHKISRYHSFVYQMNSIKLVYDLKKESIQALIQNVEKILNIGNLHNELVTVKTISTTVHENKDYGYGASAASYINLQLSDDTEIYFQTGIDDGYEDNYNEYPVMDDEYSEATIAKIRELESVYNFYAIYNDVQATLWDYSDYNPEIVITSSKDIDTVALIEKEVSTILSSM